MFYYEPTTSVSQDVSSHLAVCRSVSSHYPTDMPSHVREHWRNERHTFTCDEALSRWNIVTCGEKLTQLLTITRVGTLIHWHVTSKVTWIRKREEISYVWFISSWCKHTKTCATEIIHPLALKYTWQQFKNINTLSYILHFVSTISSFFLYLLALLLNMFIMQQHFIIFEG